MTLKLLLTSGISHLCSHFGDNVNDKAWHQQVWNCKIPTERESHMFADNSLPCYKLNLLGNSLQWILAFRNFTGDALGRAPMGEYGKQDWVEGKDELWCPSKFQRRPQPIPRGTLELEWLFWIVPIRGKEFECPCSSTGQPLERSCLWEWGHHLGWVGQLPLTKDDIPGSWGNDCLLPGCGHHVAHTAFLHKLFITPSETPVSSSIVNYLGLPNSVSLM